MAGWWKLMIHHIWKEQPRNVNRLLLPMPSIYCSTFSYLFADKYGTPPTRLHSAPTGVIFQQKRFAWSPQNRNYGTWPLFKSLINSVHTLSQNIYFCPIILKSKMDQNPEILNSSKNSLYDNLTFHKIHIFKISYFTKFTISKSNFSQNSHFSDIKFLVISG